MKNLILTHSVPSFQKVDQIVMSSIQLSESTWSQISRPMELVRPKLKTQSLIYPYTIWSKEIGVSLKSDAMQIGRSKVQLSQTLSPFLLVIPPKLISTLT